MSSLLNEYGLRQDGRKPKQLRQIVAKLGVIADADGSSYYEQGLAKMVVTVHGPMEVSKSGQLGASTGMLINTAVNVAAFSGTEQRPLGSERRSFDLCNAINQTLEAALMTGLYRGNQLNVNLQVLETDGPVLAPCLNAALLALCDAGIEMKGLFTACSAVLTEDGALLFDVTQMEETMLRNCIQLAVLHPKNELAMMQLDSRVHESQVAEVLQEAINMCQKTKESLVPIIRDHITANCITNIGDGTS